PLWTRSSRVSVSIRSGALTAHAEPRYSSCPLAYPAGLFRVRMDCPVLSGYDVPTEGPDALVDREGTASADQRLCSRDAVLGRAGKPGPSGGGRILQWLVRLGGQPDGDRVDGVHAG